MTEQKHNRHASQTKPHAGAKAVGEPPMLGTLSFELRRAHGAVMSAMGREFARWNLKPSEATLLSYIGAHPASTQSEIARAFRSEPANLVPLISRLESEGLLDRTAGRGRAIHIDLSPSGKVVLHKVNASFADLDARMAKGLDEQQREVVIHALQAICKAACEDHDGASKGVNQPDD